MLSVTTLTQLLLCSAQTASLHTLLSPGGSVPGGSWQVLVLYVNTRLGGSKMMGVGQEVMQKNTPLPGRYDAEI